MEPAEAAGAVCPLVLPQLLLEATKNQPPQRMASFHGHPAEMA